MSLRTLFVVSTPAQVEMFDAVLRSNAAGQKPVLSPLFVSLERFYSYKETHVRLIETGWPLTVLCQDQDYTRFFQTPDWRRIRAIIDARRALAVLNNEFSPTVVVLGNDIGAIEKVIIDVARRHQIPTLLVQDGIINAASIEDYGPKPHSLGGYLRLGYKYLTRRVLSGLGILSMPNKYGCGGCDRIAAMGRYSYEVLIQKGAPPERIVITGQPRFDKLVQLSQEPVSDDKDGANGQILFAAYWLSRAFKFVPKEIDWRVMERLCQVADALPEYQILIRPHPRDDPQEYQTALECLKQNRIQVVSGNLWEQIRRSNLVITYGSTVGIEAVALGKPLITISPLGDSEIIPYSAGGVSIFAGDGSALLPAVKRALFSTEFRFQFLQARADFLRYYLGDFDGRAACRVHDVIVELAGTEL